MAKKDKPTAAAEAETEPVKPVVSEGEASEASEVSEGSEPETPAEAEATVTVQVCCAALFEAGVHYLKGETFETTASRRAALGNGVSAVIAEE